MTKYKYAIVLQEPDDSMQIAAAVAAGNTFARGFICGIYRAALAVRPPLDDEMLKALELAKRRLNTMERAWPNTELSDYEQDELARAFLRANGEDV